MWTQKVPTTDPQSTTPQPHITPALQGRPDGTGRRGGWLCTNHPNTSRSLQNHSKAAPGPSHHQPGPGLPAHTRHTLSRLLCGRPSEAEFDIQKEVNHVLFMMNEANMTRITSPQISLNSSETKTTASSPPSSLPPEASSPHELNLRAREPGAHILF